MFKKIEYRRLYEDVITQIENIILAGQLAPGDKLPPERELAEEIGVSRGLCVKRFASLNARVLSKPGPAGAVM